MIVIVVTPINARNMRILSQSIGFDGGVLNQYAADIARSRVRVVNAG
jgi:hypothetical protein